MSPLLATLFLAMGLVMLAVILAAIFAIAYYIHIVRSLLNGEAVKGLVGKLLPVQP